MMNSYSKPNIYDDEDTDTQRSQQKIKVINDIDDDLEQDDFEQTKKFKRHFGNNLVCIFCRGNPLITLGPHCN